MYGHNKTAGEPSASEILRLAPDSVILQHYINDPKLPMFESWQALPSALSCLPAGRFAKLAWTKAIIFEELFRQFVRCRLKYALARCDRMGRVDGFLAETYRHLIADIRVIPNRLEQGSGSPCIAASGQAKTPHRMGGGNNAHQVISLLKSSK